MGSTDKRDYSVVSKTINVMNSSLPPPTVPTTYIGQTKRNLETRTKENFRNLGLNHTDKSALASHF